MKNNELIQNLLKREVQLSIQSFSFFKGKLKHDMKKKINAEN